MREFHVQNGDRGLVVMTGTIDATGVAQADELHRSFDKAKLEIVLKAIQEDLAEGASGGALPIRGLEWFETTRR